ncbi:hypothetical protein BOX15_Mlig034146g1 [Macrostomum lignano]|uniref:Uncharacterized protein n=1 Tax=Macrostomum lignano TaxID=282301 RepID=A0A267EH20_9PLAT|nr:hypothetical protein BOX15_Mlig034146g1 [Macrostomum lignano]
MGEEDREQCMHYVHNWHTGQDAVVPLHTMERYIMTTFAAKVNSFRDPDNPDFRPFYHDFMENEGEERQFADAHSFMNRTRLSVRRVLGCGHFILCVLYSEYCKLEKKFGESWSCLELWQQFKEDLLSKDLLNPDAPCDPEAVYSWMLSFYSNLFQMTVPTDQWWESSRIPFTQFSFTAPVEKDADMHSEEFLKNYQEFLGFHLHNMNEFALLTGDHLKQYYQLMRKEGEPPASNITRSQRNYIQTTSTTVVQKQTHVSYKETKVIAVAVGAGQTVQSLKQISSALSECTSRHKHFEKREEFRNNGRPHAGNPNSFEWHRLIIGRSSGMWRSVSSNLSVKVVNSEWKRGCKGCPAFQRWVTKSGRKRECKWVTIRRTILVRRVFWRRLPPRPMRRRLRAKKN